MKHSVIEVESSILRMEIYIANRTRDIPIQFFVTAEEKKMIRKKILLSKTANMGAYLREMAIDGIIVNTDTTYLEKQFYEMHKIGVNVNQLAKLANSTGAVTPEEMKKFSKLKKNFRIKRLLRNTVKFIVHVVIWFVPRKMLRTKHSIARSIRQSISYMMSF